MGGGYIKYQDYRRIYPGGTVIVGRQRSKFLCPCMSRSGYVGYSLYMGRYPARLPGGSSMMPLGIFTFEGGGSTRVVRSTSNNMNTLTTRRVVGRNNVTCKISCSGSFNMGRVQMRYLDSLPRVRSSGCIRSSAKGACSRIRGSLLTKGAILCAKAPYRVSKLRSFLGGSCRGLCAVSLVYRNMPSPGFFGGCLRFRGGRASKGVVCCGFHSGSGQN